MNSTGNQIVESALPGSDDQWDMLYCAETFTGGATVGVCPRGAGEHAQIAALMRRGLVEYVSHGRRVDGDNGDAESAIYAITDAGRDALRRDRAVNGNEARDKRCRGAA